MGIAKEQDSVVGLKAAVGIMEEIFAGIQADFVEVFSVIAMAFSGFTVHLIDLESFKLYLGGKI